MIEINTNFNNFDTVTGKKILEKQSNRILRDFRNLQTIKQREAKEMILKKLCQILLREISCELQNPEYTLSVCDIENGWNIQVLDGVTNFASGLANFCSAITLFKNSVATLSIAHFPIFNETVICENGIKLLGLMDLGVRKISNIGQIHDGICCVEQSFYMPKMINKVVDANMFAIVSVALGRMDAFVLKLPEWMQSIAKLYMTQAGGMISNIGPFCIGSNRTIHAQLRELVMQKIEVK